MRAFLLKRVYGGTIAGIGIGLSIGHWLELRFSVAGYFEVLWLGLVLMTIGGYMRRVQLQQNPSNTSIKTEN